MILKNMKFELLPLPYGYDALEPHIDEATMHFHHDKHHQTYVNKLNEAMEKHPELNAWDLEKIMTSINEMPEDIRLAVRNNGGGHYNHSFFWKIMGSGKGGGPAGNLLDRINQDFGSFAEFKKQFSQKAKKLFGSGWTWLFQDSDGKLKIDNFPGHDNPLRVGKKPILLIDLWEHAYYLKYQNRRPEYIEAWWNVVNWEETEKNFNA